MKKNKNKGFTLSELLVVVAIIAVLVAISIPIFTSQLHKANVATDWANVRSYYSQLQYDYLQSGTLKNEYYIQTPSNQYKDLDGNTVTLKAGTIWVTYNFCEGCTGYLVIYQCNNSDTQHYLYLSSTQTINGY